MMWEIPQVVVNLWFLKLALEIAKFFTPTDDDVDLRNVWAAKELVDVYRFLSTHWGHSLIIE